MNRLGAARGWGAGTAVLGAAMLIGPRAVAGVVSSGASAPSATLVRVLGARQLVEGVAVAVFPARRLVVTAAAVVDVVHATTMVAASRWWPRYRRPALASAAIAGLSAAAGALITERLRP